MRSTGKSWKMAVIFTAAVTLLAAGLALAPSAADAQGWGKGRGPATPEQREKMHKRFLEKRAKVLREQVGLDDATARKVEKVHDTFHTERMAIGKRMHESRFALKKLLDADSNDQKAFARAVQGILDAQKAMGDLRQREMQAVRRFLTPKQQAKLMVSIHKARRQMHRFMGRHKRAGCQGADCPRGGPGAGGPGADGGQMGPPADFGPPPGEDDDDEG